jgi:DNA polymerase-3 subunit chi
MTQIDFYTHVEDKQKTACQLAGKAFAHGLKVTVLLADREAAQRFDRALWMTPAIGFVPHCAPDDPVAAETPVIVDCRGERLLNDQVLLNLRCEWPPFFSRFRRLIEIVGRDEQDRVEARQRFRFYRDRGYPIRTHDLSRTGERSAP